MATSLDGVVCFGGMKEERLGSPTPSTNDLGSFGNPEIMVDPGQVRFDIVLK